jgi:hypothetical protein
MSTRNIKSGSPVQNTTPGVEYVLARSDIFYFLEFINYENELYSSDSSLSSKPNIIFYTENAVNKVILDYSGANTTDKTYLKNFFVGMNQTNGISLSNSSYLEEPKEIEADLSSNLTFNEFKNNYVFATVNSTTNKSAQTDVYNSEYFINTPQIKSGLTLQQNTTTKRNALVCLNVGGKSLSNLGLYVGDLLEIINGNSINIGVRFQILDILFLNNRELIVLSGAPFSEKLIGSPSIVNLYQPRIGSPSTTVDSTVFGNCIISDNITIKNATKYQCQLRSGVFIKY